LISQGAEVNAQVDGDGTPLICAVRNDHYEISRILLENGADPYLVSPGDEYAMFHARISNNKSIIDLLKKYEKDN
jgi:ankyrin repeat protein